MSRCAHCQVPTGLSCHGEQARRLCTLALADPQYADLLRRMAVSAPEAGPSPMPAFAPCGGCRGAPAYPTLAAQTASALGAAARFVASGFALAAPELVARRLATCRRCDRFDAAQARCTACGCYVEPKARVAAERCPIGKW